MKNKEANGGNIQKGGVNPPCTSNRPSEPPKGMGSPTYCGYPIKLLGPFSRYLLGIDEDSQKQTGLALEHRHDACAECSHATFIQGLDADGLYIPLVACAGGGYKAFTHRNKNVKGCQNKIAQKPVAQR